MTNDQPHPTTPSTETEEEEKKEAMASHTADRPPTDEEAAKAPTEKDLDPSVAAHYREMTRRGASQEGEGRIP